MKMTRILPLVTMLAVSSCVGVQPAAKHKVSTAKLSPLKDTAVLEEDLLAEEFAPVAETNPVDRVEFIRNYLAAQMNEYEGNRADAAIFYSRAEVANPAYKPLQEKAFSMSLLAGNWDETVRLARDLIVQEEPLPLSIIVLTVEEIRNKRYDEARRYLKRAMKVSPNMVHLQIIDGYLRIASGADAREVAGEIRDLPYSPIMSAIKHYHLGNVFVMADDMDEAELEFTMAYEQDSRSIFTVKGLAAVLQRQDKMEKVDELFTNFFSANPDNVMLLNTYTDCQKGVPVFDVNDITLDTSVADVLFNFATLLSTQNAMLSSHQILNMVEALNPEDDLAAFYKAVIFEQEGRIAQAYAAYSLVGEDSEVYAAAQVRLSGILQVRGEYDGAISIAKNLLASYKLPIFKRILAELYFSAEDYDDAVALYSEILDESPVSEAKVDEKTAWVYFARGSAYERLSDYDQATKDLQKSIDLKPNNATALNYLGYMLVDMESDIERGMSLISKALLLQPNDAAILDSMGWAWYKSGEFDKALVFFERALQGRGEDPTINLHIGRTYEMLNRKSEAHAHFKRAMDLGPDTDEDMRYLRKKLKELSSLSER